MGPEAFVVHGACASPEQLPMVFTREMLVGVAPNSTARGQHGEIGKACFTVGFVLFCLNQLFQHQSSPLQALKWVKNPPWLKSKVPECTYSEKWRGQPSWPFDRAGHCPRQRWATQWVVPILPNGTGLEKWLCF